MQPLLIDCLRSQDSTKNQIFLGSSTKLNSSNQYKINLRNRLRSSDHEKIHKAAMPTPQKFSLRNRTKLYSSNFKLQQSSQTLMLQKNQKKKSDKSNRQQNFKQKPYEKEKIILLSEQKPVLQHPQKLFQINTNQKKPQAPLISYQRAFKSSLKYTQNDQPLKHPIFIHRPLIPKTAQFLNKPNVQVNFTYFQINQKNILEENTDISKPIQKNTQQKQADKILNIEHFVPNMQIKASISQHFKQKIIQTQSIMDSNQSQDQLSILVDDKQYFLNVQSNEKLKSLSFAYTEDQTVSSNFRKSQYSSEEQVILQKNQKGLSNTA